MQEHLSSEDVEHYWTRSLAPRELLRAGDHMAVCAACRAATAARKDVAGKIASLPAVLLPAPADRVPRGRWITAAAAAILLFVAGGLAWMLRAPLSPRAVPRAIGSPIVVMIEDATGTISVDAAGHVRGVPDDQRSAVAQFLTTGRMARPSALDFVPSQAGGVVRGETAAETLHVESPANVVVAEDRPHFRWHGRRGSRFEVTVLDEQLNPIAHSPSLRVPEWTPPASLPHGRTLSWQVASEGTETAVAPAAPAHPAAFRIIDEAARAHIARAQVSGSHLLLAAAYAEAGLQEDAERELHRLATMNPRSPVARQLLDSVEAWKR